MKNLKHKFILFIFIFILLILALQIAVSFHWKDTNSYATLISWTGKINNTLIEVQKKYKIISWDILSTGENWLIVLQWGDGSITRLWSDSQLRVKENFVSQDVAQIKIVTELIKGKAWSKVITNMAGKNYFKVNFENMEAWVRGTTFDIDLRRETIFVENHEITLTKANSAPIKIWENQPFSLSLFGFISLERYFKEIQDIDWKNINLQLDKKYTDDLTRQALDSFSKNQPLLTLLEIFFPKYRVLAELHGDQDEKKLKILISQLTWAQKQGVYNKVYEEYQSINFATADNEVLYKKKMLYKKVIFLLTDNLEVKQSLVKWSIYDFQDIVSTKNSAWLEETIKFLSDQKDMITTLPDSVKNFLKVGNINILPEDFKKILLDNTKVFQDIFQIDTLKWALPDVSVDRLKSLNDSAQKSINSTLDKAFNSILPKK